MKATQKCLAKSFQFPVSKKFYQETVERINDSFSVMGNDQSSLIAATIEVFNDYLLNDSFTIGKVEAIVELVFCLLKPEIDKAMKRSSVARLRSVKKKNGPPIPQSHKRKAAKKSGLFEVVDIAELAKLLKVSDIQECDCDIEKSEIPIKENRRERRRREQELRRQSRRASGAKAYGKR